MMKNQVWLGYNSGDMAFRVPDNYEARETRYWEDENGKKLEPMEIAYIDVPDEFTGAVIEKLSLRKGELRNM